MLEALGLSVLEKLWEKLVSERKVYKKYYEIIWKKSSDLNPTDILGLRGEEEYGFNKYYKGRHHDHTIRNAIEKGEDILITGNPLAGKTRAVYHALKNLKEPVDVIAPRVVDIDTAEFKIPKRIISRRRGVLILDDIDKFTEKQGFFHLLRNFHSKDYTIIATCRSGNPYSIFKSKAERENYPPFKNEVDIPRISKEDGENVSKKAKTKLPKTFDGNIGSIFLPLEAMIDRIKNSTLEEKGVLRSIGRLYATGIYEQREQFNIERIKKVCKEWLELDLRNYEWDNLLKKLKTNGFFEIYQDIIEVEEAYLYIFSSEGVSLKDFQEMLKIFQGDPEALYSLGNRAVYIGEVVIDKAELMKVSIEANNGALKVWTRKSNPEKYGWAKNSLGFAYWRLSEVEHKKENIILAVKAFNKALKVRTFKKDPENYAMTQMNLGIAYSILSEVEYKAQNAKRAILAYEEAFKVYNHDYFPIQYAKTQMNMGGSYIRLSEVEEKAQNAKKAIEVFKVALNVYTIDRFPSDYANTQMNLGSAHARLSEVEEKSENLKRAITAYEKALKVYTLDRFPMDYAATQINLGVAYIMLSYVIDQMENLKRAFNAFKEALKVYTEDKFPMQFQMIMHNASIGMERLQKLEEEGKAKK